MPWVENERRVARVKNFCINTKTRSILLFTSLLCRLESALNALAAHILEVGLKLYEKIYLCLEKMVKSTQICRIDGTSWMDGGLDIC